MKSLFIAAAIAATLASPHAFAQAKNFEGLSLLGAVNATGNKVDSGGNSTKKTDSNGSFQAEYGFAVEESIVLGLGFNAGLSDYKISDQSAKLKNTYSVYIAPGFALSKDTLVYGKLAAVSAKAESDSASANLSGIGYGVGARLAGSKNVFFQVEYVFNKYDETNFGPSKVNNETGVLSFGIGYKF